jgi:hypothetical protein
LLTPGGRAKLVCLSGAADACLCARQEVLVQAFESGSPHPDSDPAYRPEKPLPRERYPFSPFPAEPSSAAFAGPPGYPGYYSADDPAAPAPAWPASPGSTLARGRRVAVDAVLPATRARGSRSQPAYLHIADSEVLNEVSQIAAVAASLRRDARPRQASSQPVRLLAARNGYPPTPSKGWSLGVGYPAARRRATPACRAMLAGDSERRIAAGSRVADAVAGGL